MINYFNNAGLEREDTYFDPCCGTGSMLLYLHEEYGIPFNNLYGVDISPSNVELCHSIGLTNVICGDILKDIKEIREMHFDKIIMNPPYDRSLHLKILRQVMNKADEVVNLSPIRWLQDPLAEMKGNRADYGRFADIRSKITSLEVVDGKEAEKMFGIGLPFDLGIYYLTGEEKEPFKLINNSLLIKMINKIQQTDNLNKHIVIDDMKGICCLISLFTGGRNGDTEKYKKHGSFNYFNKEKCYFNDGVNVYTGETYLEQRTKTAWGNVKAKAENTNVKFNTTEERENFYNSWNTKTLLWLFRNMVVDVHVHPQFLPYLPDYTHSWTDEMLYEYFGLTDSEIQEIEQTV